MDVESWITPEETPALAEAAVALIEARLSRFSPAERAAYWASIRKAYNTPYNPPAPRKAKPAPVTIPVADLPSIDLPSIDLPAAALGAARPVEIQAA